MTWGRRDGWIGGRKETGRQVNWWAGMLHALYFYIISILLSNGILERHGKMLRFAFL